MGQGTSWSSAQFLFDPAEFKFVKHHWIFLDHDQRITASLGGSYTWQDWKAVRYSLRQWTSPGVCQHQDRP